MKSQSINTPVITPFNTSKWISFSLINFLVLAVAGLILRYKIVYFLPQINQKYLLHSHSHFAFVGWLALAFMVMMLSYLRTLPGVINYRKYHWTLWANTITAYGMLFTFVVQGYAKYSITFSTLSLFVSYVFIYQYWKDLNAIKASRSVSLWFKTGFVIWALSSCGAYSLAFLMARHIVNADLTFSAIYFYMHFQYNGWMLFIGFGLLFAFLNSDSSPQVQKVSKNMYAVLGLTVIPSYFLSIIGLHIPSYLYAIAVVSGILQLLAIVYILKLLKIIKSDPYKGFSPTTGYLWSVALFSFVLKTVLQGLSVLPYFSQSAIGFRPVVIGYLHLCFMGMISFFILGYFNEILAGEGRGLSKKGIAVLTAGIVLQELVLMGEGLESMRNQLLPHADVYLFAAAGIIVVGIAILVCGKEILTQKKRPS